MIHCWDVCNGLKVLQHGEKYQSEYTIVIYSTWVMLCFGLAWQQRGNKQRSSEEEVDGCSLPLLTTVSRWRGQGSYCELVDATMTSPLPSSLSHDTSVTSSVATLHFHRGIQISSFDFIRILFIEAKLRPIHWTRCSSISSLY